MHLGVVDKWSTIRWCTSQKRVWLWDKDEKSKDERHRKTTIFFTFHPKCKWLWIERVKRGRWEMMTSKVDWRHAGTGVPRLRRKRPALKRQTSWSAFDIKLFISLFNMRSWQICWSFYYSSSSTLMISWKNGTLGQRYFPCFLLTGFTGFDGGFSTGLGS